MVIYCGVDFHARQQTFCYGIEARPRTGDNNAERAVDHGKLVSASR
jgi:hypothetical protein